MMMCWRQIFQAVAGLCVAAIACAQDAPSLHVTAKLQAPAQVQVGATVQLELQVMTPAWFTQPPQLPTLELPGAMVTPPSGQGAIVHEKKDGVAYSGLRYTYVLSPTQAGTLQIPALTVSAQIGPGGVAATDSSEPFSFNVVAGSKSAGPSGGEVAASQLTISQNYALAPDPLMTGGRVTRSIMQRAEGVQAMLLPAAALNDVPGFKRYPHEPQVTTLTDGRGGFVGGQRIDSADYIPSQAGEVSLPPVIMHWRDNASGQLQQQELPGRTFTVAAAPVVEQPFSLTEDLAKLRHNLRWVLPAASPAWAISAVLVLLLAWLCWPWSRRCTRRLRSWAMLVRDRRRAGEPWHWRAWRREATQNTAALSAFYQWLWRVTGAYDLRAAVAPLGEPASEVAATILRQAYGANPGDASWRHRLAAASSQWRRIWQARHMTAPAYALPASLNPVRNPAYTSRDMRKRGRL